jgi:predicted AlkP superfamily phosphohydrolase/phosphomutase/Tfp pilus assembly protein PilF
MGHPLAHRRARRLLLALVTLFWTLSSLACRKPPEAAAPKEAAGRRLPVELDDPPRESLARGDRPRVVLIGLDGADWTLLDRLAASGAMPNFARLVREGRSMRLRSFVPLLSPVVWATITTGASPAVHGVLDFQEVEPGTGSIVPISGRSRRVPAVWNVASAEGLRVGVVGWWGTHPAEEVNGFFVSDHAGSILFEGSKDAMTFPPALSEGVLRVVEGERQISDADLAPYFRMNAEELAGVKTQGGGLENPVVAMEKILAATRSVQRIARDLYDRERPELTAVYFEGSDAIGHVFASYVPPRLPCVSDEDFRRYSRTVDAYHTTVDRLLGQWIRRAEEDGATLMICSDHGFKWEEDRTCQRSSLAWATAAFWHRLDGILLVWGKNVKASPGRGDASVYDVAPTVSALLKLPVDPRMQGKPLLSAFQGVSSPLRREVFRDVAIRRLASNAPTAAQRSEYAEKLRALGYLTGSESKSLPVADEGPLPGRTEGAWNNLGLYQREAGLLDEAERSFRESLRLKPDYSSPMFNLAVLERTRGRWGPAIEWLFRSLAAGHAEPEETLLQWVSAAMKAKRRSAAVAILERGIERHPKSEKLACPLARLRLEGKDCQGALAALRDVAETGSRETLNLLGLSEMCLGHRERARQYLERSLALDPAQPPIREALRLMAGAA